MTYDAYAHGFHSQRFDGNIGGIAAGPWSDFIAPGGFNDGLTVRTRPGVVHSIIIEKAHDLGAPFPNILVLDWPDTLVASGPPVSANTTLALSPVSLPTTGSYVVELHMECKQGILVRFENLPNQARICVVYFPGGRSDRADFIQRR